MQKYFYVFTIILIWGIVSVGSKVGASSIIKVEKAWIRESSGPNAALFMTLTNLSGAPQALRRADLEVCAYAELHTHKEEKGVFKMRQVDVIEIPPQGHQELKPGGYHVMLMKLHVPLRAGEQIPVILHFREGESLQVTVPVRAMGEEFSPCSCSE